MRNSRDRSKWVGQKARPKINDSELAVRVREACQLMRQQNEELRGLFEQRRKELLAKLPQRGRIQ